MSCEQVIITVYDNGFELFSRIVGINNVYSLFLKQLSPRFDQYQIDGVPC